MTQYFKLLYKIAEEFNIKRGADEPEIDWKARIVYSFLGQVGYSALYDVQEDLQNASIIHLDDRIIETLDHLLLMYPELLGVYIEKDKKLSDEIYDIYFSTGCIYHEPNRIRPSIRSCSNEDDCVFLRGQALEEKVWLSGLGCYIENKISRYYSGWRGTS